MKKLNLEKQFEVNENSLKATLKNWNIENFKYSFPKAGVENITVFIDSSKGDFVLRVYRNEGVNFIEEIKKEIEFMNFLSLKGIKVPGILQNNLGNLISEALINGINWYSILMVKVSGSTPKSYTNELLKQLGEELAQVHIASLEYSRNLNWRFFSREEEWDKLEIEDTKSKDAANLIQKARGFAFDTELDLPKAIIHNDITKANLMAEGDQLTAILDFEGIKYSYLINDLGVIIWGVLFSIFKGKIPKDSVEVLIGSYSKIRPLTNNEKFYLKEAVKFRNYQLAYMDFALNDEQGLEDEIFMERVIEFYDWSSFIDK